MGYQIYAKVQSNKCHGVTRIFAVFYKITQEIEHKKLYFSTYSKIWNKINPQFYILIESLTQNKLNYGNKNRFGLFFVELKSLCR